MPFHCRRWWLLYFRWWDAAIDGDAVRLRYCRWLMLRRYELRLMPSLATRCFHCVLCWCRDITLSAMRTLVDILFWCHRITEHHHLLSRAFEYRVTATADLLQYFRRFFAPHMAEMLLIYCARSIFTRYFTPPDDYWSLIDATPITLMPALLITPLRR